MSKPRVTIAGGGIAGMAAALRLAQCGYPVTLYEEKEMLGGNLASRRLRDGRALDVYPHMYQSWYENFWSLIKDAGVDREAEFTSFDTVHQLQREQFPHFTHLTKPYSLSHLVDNLSSNVAPTPDMFVFGFATIDLMAELLNRTARLTNMSLTGYLNSRLYLTKTAIQAYEAYVAMIWAIPGYLISAEDCRRYLTYCYPAAEENIYLTRGPADDVWIKPLTKALEAAGVELRPNTRLEGVTCEGERVRKIKLVGTRWDKRHYTWVASGEAWEEPVEELLLAVPAPVLATLVRKGKKGKRIVDAVPALAELKRLTSQAIPMLHLSFQKKIEGIPKEPVGLFESKLNLAFTDISQTWQGVRGMSDRTVLAISCSETSLLAGPLPEDDGYAIMAELQEYVKFDLGEGWKESPDIDWSLTRYEANADAALSVNAIGTDQFRPAACYQKIANLSFAGDYCQHNFGITTLEAATATGLAAARAITDRQGGQVELLTPPTWPDEMYVGARYALAPAAYAAKLWSMGRRTALGMSPDLGQPASPAAPPPAAPTAGPPGASKGAPAATPKGSPSGAPKAGPATAPEGPGSEPPRAAGDMSLLRYLLTPGLPPRERRPER